MIKSRVVLIPFLLFPFFFAPVLSAEDFSPALDYSQVQVPLPRFAERVHFSPYKSSDAGAAALARIVSSADFAANYSWSSAAGDLREINKLLESAKEISSDPENPQTKNLMGAVLNIYVRVMVSGLKNISVNDEREYAAGFFSGFFNVNDNKPGEVKVLSDYLSALTPYRLRRDYEYEVGVLTDGGDMAMGKGGEILVISGDYASKPKEEAAAVIAHELVHNENRHFMQYYLVEALNRKLLPGISSPLGKKTLALAANQYKWLCEYQADGVAAVMLKRAGFDPKGLSAVLKKLPVSKADLTNDHPPAQLRLKELKNPDWAK